MKSMSPGNREPFRYWKYITYLSLSLMVLILAVILREMPGEYFRRFFGEISPILVISLASILGIISLWYLESIHAFFLINKDRTIKGMAISTALASVFAIMIIIVDVINPYPKYINVPFPQAMLFYPSIGFVVEVIFHLVPLALLLFLLKRLERQVGTKQIIWLCILIVAILEPTFQMLFQGNGIEWKDIYTWFHIFAINVFQLYIFRRFDFVSMYTFRFVYYIQWHILWGVIRLNVLF